MIKYAMENGPIEDILRRKESDRQRRLLIKVKYEETKAQILRAKKKINLNSERIVLRKTLLEGETSRDRLCKPIGTIRNSAAVCSANSPSFRPVLNEASKEIVSRCFNKRLDFQQRLSEWLQSREAFLDRERKRVLEEAEKDCTFQPTIQPTSAEIAATRRSVIQNIPDRHAMWALNRDRRIEAERRKKQDDELAACSFAPNVTKGSLRNNCNNNYNKKTSLVTTTSLLPVPVVTLFEEKSYFSLGRSQSLPRLSHSQPAHGAARMRVSEGGERGAGSPAHSVKKLENFSTKVVSIRGGGRGRKPAPLPTEGTASASPDREGHGGGRRVITVIRDTNKGDDDVSALSHSSRIDTFRGSPSRVSRRDNMKETSGLHSPSPNRTWRKTREARSEEPVSGRTRDMDSSLHIGDDLLQEQQEGQALDDLHHSQEQQEGQALDDLHHSQSAPSSEPLMGLDYVYSHGDNIGGYDGLNDRVTESSSHHYHAAIANGPQPLFEYVYSSPVLSDIELIDASKSKFASSLEQNKRPMHNGDSYCRSSNSDQPDKENITNPTKNNDDNENNNSKRNSTNKLVVTTSSSYANSNLVEEAFGGQGSALQRAAQAARRALDEKKKKR